MNTGPAAGLAAAAGTRVASGLSCAAAPRIIACKVRCEYGIILLGMVVTAVCSSSASCADIQPAATCLAASKDVACRSRISGR